jgi:hypothetical protein
MLILPFKMIEKMSPTRFTETTLGPFGRIVSRYGIPPLYMDVFFTMKAHHWPSCPLTTHTTVTDGELFGVFDCDFNSATQTLTLHRNLPDYLNTAFLLDDQNTCRAHRMGYMLGTYRCVEDVPNVQTFYIGKAFFSIMHIHFAIKHSEDFFAIIDVPLVGLIPPTR